MKKNFKNIAFASIVFGSLIFTSCHYSVGHSDAHSHGAEATEDAHNHNEATEGMAVLSQVQRKAIDLEVGTMPYRTMKGVVKASGQLEVSPSNKAEVTAYVGGNVVSINAFQGDKVKKGQVLAVLEHPDIIQLQQDFIEKCNDLKYLEKDYNRQKELYQQEVGSGKKYQKAEADYHTAKAQYQGLKLRLQMLKLNTKSIEKGNIVHQLKIISPISGYVSGINISLGSYIDARTKMFSIRNFEDIHADLSVYEKDIRKVATGQKVRLRVANLPNIELKGSVFAIAKEYTPNSRSVVVHASIDNPPKKLIADSYVSGEILTESDKVRAVPEAAIVNDGDKHFIFVFDEKGSLAANHDEDDHDHAADDHQHDNGEDHAHAADTHGEGEEHDHNHDHATDDHQHDNGEAHNHATDTHQHGEGEAHDHDHDHAVGEAHDHDMEGIYQSLAKDKIAYRMVEVITGEVDGGYVEITAVDPLSDHELIVLRGAYYLLSDLKKSEAAHQH